MARPLRIDFEGAVYHVTTRGNARQDIFLHDEDRAEFLNVFADVVDRFGWNCHAYCLMANHYHLLIETPKANLSKGKENPGSHLHFWCFQGPQVALFSELPPFRLVLLTPLYFRV